jgi:hypothetical protein
MSLRTVRKMRTYGLEGVYTEDSHDSVVQLISHVCFHGTTGQILFLDCSAPGGKSLQLLVQPLIQSSRFLI